MTDRANLAMLAAACHSDGGHPARAALCARCDRLLIAPEVPATCSCGIAWDVLPALVLIEALTQTGASA